MFYGAEKEIFQRARELRRNMTEAEKILWSRIRNKQINNTVFRRQHPIDIFIVDFYCHKHKLVIELDGGIHKHPDIQERDKNRSAEMEKYGLKIIRFTNNEILSDVNKVIEKIKKYMK